jgi:hypothetical protein
MSQDFAQQHVLSFSVMMFGRFACPAGTLDSCPIRVIQVNI